MLFDEPKIEEIEAMEEVSLLPMLGVFFLGSLLLLISFSFTAHGQELTVDSDLDGLSDYSEITIYGTNPSIADTDGDGVGDGEEIKNWQSPLKAKTALNKVDTDSDGLNDAWEIKLGSNPLVTDSDGDGYFDGDEVKLGYSPTSTDRNLVAKRIEVNIAKFELRYYHGDVLLESFKVSTGKPSLPTPPGDYKVMAKIPVKHYFGPGFDLPNTKWNLQFTKRHGMGYYVHGAYWHNLFGIRNVSHGCVNVAYKDMENLYNWAQVGTPVIIR